MPKRPAGIPAESVQDRFARRLEEEIARRGWSDATLAHRASEHRPSECREDCHHYPMSASTVWKMKSAKPKRRVDIDEATAIAVGAFGYATIEAFLEDSPLEALRSGLGELGQTLDWQMRLADGTRERADVVKALLEEQSIKDALAARPEEARALAEQAQAWALVCNAYLTQWRLATETYRIIDRLVQGGEDVQ